MSEHGSDSMKIGDMWHALQLTELHRGLCNQLPMLPVLRWGWGRPDIRVSWALFRQRVGEINWFVHLETLQGVYNAFHLLIFLCQFLPNLGSEGGGQPQWIESFRLHILYQHQYIIWLIPVRTNINGHEHIKSEPYLLPFDFQGRISEGQTVLMDLLYNTLVVHHG